ncbi:hypothetical protein Bcep1808_7640 (plasmid) [Burkholderia vietnamiensis G4]|uniref:Uncharacterized protein n=1 Tax=Burkholderia vietnamiensis (strain G4 / LMG 22486) TaxID=269482 RepID=A4JW57_BURVG|nr:hypothetical protein Bcep1808_7640 [Burkholderia vietnamiensis G4]
MTLQRIYTSNARAADVRNLERQVTTSPRARASSIYEITRDRAVWRVPVPGQSDRYMSASAGHVGDDHFQDHE